jgi:hypothetical protein
MDAFVCKAQIRLNQATGIQNQIEVSSKEAKQLSLNFFEEEIFFALSTPLRSRSHQCLCTLHLNLHMSISMSM